MKERVTRNVSLKILSLLLAVLLWIVIINVEDPVVTANFANIEVVKINENVLKSKDQVYEVISGDTVDVKVKGKRSKIGALKTSDFQVTADLSKLSVVDAVPINISIPKYGEAIEIVDRDIFTMKVRLENLETQQFRIDVVEKGTVSDGYYVKEKIARPNMIQVSAAETIVNKIQEVVVEVDVANANESFKVTALPKVYDKNGSLMDSSKMSFNYDEVEVAVNLLQTKTVSLFIDLKGTPFYGYQYVNFRYEPQQVVIAGEQEVLDKIQYIKGEYIIDNKSEDVAGEINIKDFIKEDVILIDENQNAVINVDVIKLDSKEIGYNTNEIEIRNVPAGMKVGFNHNDIINVKVFADNEAISAINKYSLTPYIDMEDETVGTKFVTIQFDKPEEVISTSNPSISVTLSDTGD